MLPGMDGFQVLSEIRKSSTVPVLMLTAKGDEIDKVTGGEKNSPSVFPAGSERAVFTLFGAKFIFGDTPIKRQPKHPILFLTQVSLIL